MRYRQLLVPACAALLFTGCSSEKASLSLTSQDNYLEYGIDLWESEEDIHPDLMKFIRKYNGDLSFDDSEFDSFTLGEQSLYITAETEEDDVTEELKVTVRDTQAPVIELASPKVYVQVNDYEFDPAENILNVYDPAEGELLLLEFFEEDDGIYVLDEPYEDWGFYAVDFFSVDITQAGEYPVRITACDNHGNITEAEYTAVVAEEAQTAAEDMKSVQGEVSKHLSDPDEIYEEYEKVLESYCTQAGGDWEEGCYLYFETDTEIDDDWGWVEGDEIDSAGEDWDDEEWYEDDEEWYDDSEEDEYDEDWDDEEWEEDWDNEESDPEQDCYDMGGEWIPEAGGCAWFDDEEE